MTQPPPPYWKPSKHLGDKRAAWHDYTSRCFYMVTVKRHPDCPAPLSRIEPDPNRPDHPLNIPTAHGQSVVKAIVLAESQFRHVRIISHTVMPDHFHILVFVRTAGICHLGKIISHIKHTATDAEPLIQFEPGYHDRIVTRRCMLQNLRQYIEDNPRRHLIRHTMPHLFSRGIMLAHGDWTACAYGNFTLLKDPVKSALIVSSKYDDNERRRLKAKWDETARTCGVFISPLISPAERELMRQYLAQGAKLIKLVSVSFGPRYNPPRAEFELCARGRMLILGDMTGPTGRDAMTRARALELNERARFLAADTDMQWSLRPWPH